MSKRQKTKKILSMFGVFLMMAVFAMQMNACGKKDKGSEQARANPYGGYPGGYYGNPAGVVGNGIGVSADRTAALELNLRAGSFNGSYVQSVGADGLLYIYSPTIGCNLAPGQYYLTSTNTVQSVSGSFDGLSLRAQQGLTIDIGSGWLYGSAVTWNGKSYSRKLFAYAQIVQDYPAPASCSIAFSLDQ